LESWSYAHTPRLNLARRIQFYQFSAAFLYLDGNLCLAYCEY
jgi:hypothetical protein